MASARRTAVSRSAACSVRASPAARKLASRSGPLSPISTAAAARSATTGAQGGEVEALAPSAGDQHDRRIEGAQRGGDRVGLRPLRVVDEPDAVDDRHPLEAMLDAFEGRAPPRGSRPARRRRAAPPRSRPARWTRCGRPGCQARPTGMIRPSDPVVARPPPASVRRSIPAATIQPSTTPRPPPLPGSGQSRR